MAHAPSPDRRAGAGRLPLGPAAFRFAPRTIVELAVIGVVYFALAKIGLALASINASASPIWPPTGIALAAVILRGYRVWPAIFLAALAANATTAVSIPAASVIALGNTLECVVGGYLAKRWSGGAATFETPSGVTRFALISLAAATPISATVGVGTLLAAGYAEAADAASIWITWWLGDLAGALVVTPVAVLWARADSRALDRDALPQTAALYGAACAVGIVAFSPLVEQTTYRDPLGFLAIVPLLWAALRFGLRDTATTALILSLLAVWGTMGNSGPFARATLNDSFLLLLMFMISTAVPSLALSADVAVRKQTQRRMKLLAAEVDHRAKNMLAVVQAILRLTRADTVGGFVQAFEGRLHALARAHALLSDSKWEGVELRHLVEKELTPYRTDSGRVRIDGPAVWLEPAAAQSIGMAVHELATNAAKYGALSTPDGRLELDWMLGGTAGLTLRWRETDGPPVTSPVQSGVGTRVIERTIGGQLGGTVRFDWRPSGLACEIAVPAGQLTRAQPRT